MVQLKWLHQFEFAGYYAADIQGFYKKRGINVKLKQGDKNHSPATEVLRGRATFGITDCDLLINFMKGDPVVAMGVLFQHSPYVILATPYQNIHSPSDLMGKSLMTADNYGRIEMEAMLVKEGIPLDSVFISPTTYKIADIINGKADAITGNIAVEPFEFQQLKVDFNTISPVTYGIDFYADIFFTRQSVIDNDPGLVKAFKEATIEGWEYAMDNPEELADYILTLPFVQKRGVTKEALLYEAKQMHRLMMPELVEIGHMNEGRWQHIAEIYKNLDIVTPKDNSLEAFFYNPENTRLQNITQKIIYISIGILAVIAAIILYSLSLKRAVTNRTSLLANEITEGNKIREKLVISEERLDLATEAAGIGIWDWTMRDNTLYLSDICKTMLGYSPDELPSSQEVFFSLIHAEDKEEVSINRARQAEGVLEKLQMIYRMRTRSGGYKWILAISRASTLGPNGKATRISGILLDVDDIKKNELELNQLSQELLVSNKELKQFAYITSHNLRSPVANLLMLMQLFSKDELSDKNKQLFVKTEYSIQQLNNTLSDLNEILSARFNKSEKKEEVYFELVLKEVMNSISEDIEQTGAVIEYRFEDAPMLVYSKKILESILLNLLTNGIKYAKPSERPHILLSSSQNKDTITLTVQDEGIGLDLEKHGKKLFGLYQRFHEGPAGKGLGLYIVKNQVEAQNGVIEVESKVGEGTTFFINFIKTHLVDEELSDKNIVSGR